MGKIKPLEKAVKKKKEKISTWKKKCDVCFAHFIRKRDAEFGGPCITCGRLFPYEELDCGHFVPRDCIITRYDPHNCNGQCFNCNRFNDGEQALHYKAIEKKFGKGEGDRLLELYKQSKANPVRYSVEFYKPIYERYKKYK